MYSSGSRLRAAPFHLNFTPTSIVSRLRNATVMGNPALVPD